MLRFIGLLLIIILVALQAKLWFGEGNLHEVHKLRQDIAQQRAENARLKARNEALAADVKDLKSGDQAVESRARSDLGMIKPGETFYQVVGPTPAASSQSADGH